MGSFFIADAVTGRAIMDYEPVVGLLLSHQGNKYPLDKNPNDAGIYPGHFFAPDSLPVFGTYGDYGRIAVEDERQFGVRLATFMTGTPSWEELMERGLNPNAGVCLFGQDPDTAKGGPESVKRSYGLYVIHQSTYNYLVYGGNDEASMAKAKGQRDTDVAAIKAMFDVYLREFKAFEERVPRDSPDWMDQLFDCGLYELESALSLRGTWEYTDPASKQVVQLPPLAGAMSGNNLHKLGSDFLAAAWQIPFYGFRLRKLNVQSAEEVPNLTAFLELLWEMQQLNVGLYSINAHYFPSWYAGQETNDKTIMALNCMSLEQAFNAFAARTIDYAGKKEGLSRIDEKLKELERMVHRMRTLRDSFDSVERSHPG